MTRFFLLLALLVAVALAAVTPGTNHVNQISVAGRSSNLKRNKLATTARTGQDGNGRLVTTVRDDDSDDDDSDDDDSDDDITIKERFAMTGRSGEKANGRLAKPVRSAEDENDRLATSVRDDSDDDDSDDDDSDDD